MPSGNPQTSVAAICAVTFPHDSWVFISVRIRASDSSLPRALLSIEMGSAVTFHLSELHLELPRARFFDTAYKRIGANRLEAEYGCMRE
jgi:hypothetical protein